MKRRGILFAAALLASSIGIGAAATIGPDAAAANGAWHACNAIADTFTVNVWRSSTTGYAYSRIRYHGQYNNTVIYEQTVNGYSSNFPHQTIYRPNSATWNPRVSSYVYIVGPFGPYTIYNTGIITCPR